MGWEGWMTQHRKRGELKWKFKFCDAREEAERFVAEMKVIGCDANFWCLVHGG